MPGRLKADHRDLGIGDAVDLAVERLEPIFGVVEGEAAPHDCCFGIDDSAFVLEFADVDAYVNFLWHFENAPFFLPHPWRREATPVPSRPR